MWILSFLLGTLFGSCATLYVIYKSLTAVDPNSRRKEIGAIDLDTNSAGDKKTADTTVFDAFKKAADAVRSNVSKTAVVEPAPATKPDNYANMSPVELEKVYLSELKVFRDNQKQMKLFHTFFIELSKSFSTHGKDLSRLSHSAHGNLTKMASGAQSGEAETLAVYMESLSEEESSSASCMDVWWKSLSIALDHVSHDTDVLAIKLTAEIGFEIQRLSEEYVLIEKKLFEDGSRYLAQLKECNTAYDLKIKDKCKHQERLEKLMLLPNQGGSEAARIQSKINACDTGLQESATALNIITSHFVSAMPRIISSIGLYNLKSKSVLSAKLMTFVDACTVYDAKVTQVFQRLREDCMVVVRATSAKDVKMLLSGQVDASTALQLEEIRKMFKAASETDDRLAAEAEAPRVDMTSVAMAALAASSPEDVKVQLQSPTELLLPVIGTETCVWLNAFTGRIYRDISKSREFHVWLCALVGRLLNKAPKRPDYIEEFKIENVEFGGLPPIIRNVKWIPGEASASRARSDTSTSQDGEDGKAAAPQVPGTAKNMPAYDLNSFPYDPEFDVNCEGDLTFRSGVQFSVSTKIWINWPKEKYASIPVLLKLNMEEVAGRIRFGVIKNSCCFSFLEMPYTRFRVVSELGDQFKIKNLPKLSDMIIKQIRKVMFNRMVYPHAHTFKLVWPRHWWPKGTREDWPHQGPVFNPDPGAPAPAPAAAAGSTAPETAGAEETKEETAGASKHTSNLSILSKKPSSSAPATGSCAPLTESCVPDSSAAAVAEKPAEKPAEKKGGFRSAISSFFHQSTKNPSPLHATPTASATTVKAVPVAEAPTASVKATIVPTTVPTTAGATSSVTVVATPSSTAVTATATGTATGSSETAAPSAVKVSSAPSSAEVSPEKSAESATPAVVPVLEKKALELDTSVSNEAVAAASSSSSSSAPTMPAASRRLSKGKQGSLDDIGLQTTDAEEREREKPASPRTANDDSSSPTTAKITPIRRRLSHVLPETDGTKPAATTLGTDILTQKPITMAPRETFMTVVVDEFPKAAGTPGAAAMDQSFELTPDKNSFETSRGATVSSSHLGADAAAIAAAAAAGAPAAPVGVAAEPVAKKRTSSFSGLAALLHGGPANSTVPPIATAPGPAAGAPPEKPEESQLAAGDDEDAAGVLASKTNSSSDSSFNSNGEAAEADGAPGGSRWRSMLQAGKERILHGKGAPATPAAGTSSKVTSPAQLPVPIKKPDEILSAYVSIPSPGAAFSEAKLASLKKYFIVLRKQKLLIYNNADEYNKSSGATGTRASYTLLGSMCRPTSETETGFEIWFSPTSSYNKGKRSGDPDKWLTFWAASEVESKQWILGIMAQSEPS
jgi:hypothetical protein